MLEDDPAVKYLTVKEVSEIVRRSPQTIYRWIEEGYIGNYVKVKDGYLIPKTEIARILEISTE